MSSDPKMIGKFINAMFKLSRRICSTDAISLNIALMNLKHISLLVVIIIIS